MKVSRSTKQVLGIVVTSRALHGVLVENGADGPALVRRFTRQRNRAGAGDVAGAAGAVPGLGGGQGAAGDFGSDVSIQLVDQNDAGRDLFLGSEFSVFEQDGDEAGARLAPTFELELRDLFDEVRDAGYGDVPAAFVMQGSDVAYADVLVPGDAAAPKGKRPDREALLELLSTQYTGSFDEDRLTFLPMTSPEDGGTRHLAVFPKPAERLTATLRVLGDGSHALPPVAGIDAEVPVYLGLLRGARVAGATSDGAPAEAAEDVGAAPEEKRSESVLVVRVGHEDTLVLCIEDGRVRHCESLRSLTAYDAHETICSRVLLQQDEHGVGAIDRILVLAEDRERALVETMGLFFPDTPVEALRASLPEGVRADEPSSAVVCATGVALRLLAPDGYDGVFEPVDFLPRKLLKSSRKLQLPAVWQMAMLAVLLGATSVFFATTYAQAETEIAMYEERLRLTAPEELGADIVTLQAQIDSMQALYDTYTEALHVLDSLLVGSDRWSRSLELTSTEAAQVKGLWVEQLSPQDTTLLLVGNAVGRDRVVDFATRTGATIEALTFSEIREWPVYTFRLRLSLPTALPEAAVYLRERALSGFTVPVADTTTVAPSHSPAQPE